MDKLYEQDRFNFVLQRDGLEAALAFARQCMRLYLRANTTSKRRYGKRTTYRKSYLESAFSFRYLSRLVVQISQS